MTDQPYRRADGSWDTFRHGDHPYDDFPDEQQVECLGEGCSELLWPDQIQRFGPRCLDCSLAHAYGSAGALAGEDEYDFQRDQRLTDGLLAERDNDDDTD